MPDHAYANNRTKTIGILKKIDYILLSLLIMVQTV